MKKTDKLKNIIALQIKHYIYLYKCTNRNISLGGLISSIKTMYDLQKYISYKNNEKESFDESWRPLTDLFS